MPQNTISDQHSTVRRNYEQLSEKLVRTTDPAQIVVLESCLAELAAELEGEQHARDEIS